ncbi:hypothetical protein GQ44DRAFT_629239 [Phaeosphaeriaceae sp. PMI808]|nr:hypothetical protein GQ44DRAFT_629239 [Phaeosphaeriaceae sp. PMI808]
MKTNTVISILLFSYFAIAAPTRRHALVIQTEVVTKTVVIFTTVYNGIVGEATTTPTNYLYELPKASFGATALLNPPPPDNILVQEKQSAIGTTAIPFPLPTTAIERPQPVDSPNLTKSPQPAMRSASTPAQSAPSFVLALPSPVAATTSRGEIYTGDGTIYNGLDGIVKGACGMALNDSNHIVALAKPTWGESTHDIMTGESSNPWCGQDIEVRYKGKTTKAVIMDLCPGCKGADLDFSPAAWRALTGGDVIERIYNVSWNKIP